MAELSFDLSLRFPGREIAMVGAVPLEGVTGIAGPSGSGKTTLLRMLSGLEPRARGRVRFGGTVWADGGRGLGPEARRVGMVFQDARLFPHMTVAENIAYGAARRRVPASAVEGAAAGLGLSGLMDRRPATLSGGEARRVALARALASGPDILFLDEPLSALDDETKGQVLPYLARAVSGSGIPVLYVTHSAEEITRFADRVLAVADGRIAGWGRPPARLAVTILDSAGGMSTVDLGGAAFRLPGYGEAGDARVIGIPEAGLLLSLDNPGPSGALAVLRARVASVAPRPSGPVLGLEVAGQSLFWQIAPGALLADRVPEPGGALWLSLLAAHLR